LIVDRVFSKQRAVSSYQFSNLWRFIICTQTTGLLVNQLHQKLAPARNVKRFKRGHDQGQGEKSNKTKSKFSPTIAGIVLATSLLGIGFFNTTQAHAADLNFGNLDLAKKTIQNVAPLVTNQKVDEKAASYVFTPDEFVQKPLIIDTQITVEPPKPVVKQVVKTTKVSAATTSVQANTSTDTSEASPHRFPYGYCTYYVSSHRFVPWSGNAISWLSGARSFGYATGDEPKAGAILVTSEGGRTGHVALVDSVNGDGTISLTEMNYAGFGVISSRTISATYGPIMGYIY
jgi:surface antigen